MKYSDSHSVNLVPIQRTLQMPSALGMGKCELQICEVDLRLDNHVFGAEPSTDRKPRSAVSRGLRSKVYIQGIYRTEHKGNEGTVLVSAFQDMPSVPASLEWHIDAVFLATRSAQGDLSEETRSLFSRHKISCV